MSALDIHMFPCLSDNYGFLIHDPVSGETACIDTPELGPIEAALAEKNWQLSAIWNTHHHFDHVGCNQALKDKYGVEIIGPQSDAHRIPGLDHGVSHGDEITLGAHKISIIATPGHTTGHIIYYVPGAETAFVGDTIFVMGCGRLFEGSPADMFESMRRIEALPAQTKLYCAHEYTLSNARFAATIEPNNADLADAIRAAKKRRDDDLPTVPTTVAAEQRTNPFMRAKTAERLGDIRAQKDSF